MVQSYSPAVRVRVIAGGGFSRLFRGDEESQRIVLEHRELCVNALNVLFVRVRRVRTAAVVLSREVRVEDSSALRRLDVMRKKRAKCQPQRTRNVFQMLMDPAFRLSNERTFSEMFLLPPKNAPDPLTLTRCGRTVVPIPREEVDGHMVRACSSKALEWSKGSRNVSEAFGARRINGASAMVGSRRVRRFLRHSSRWSP